MNSKKPANVDDYIASFPEPAKSKLADLRSTIFEIVPEVEESISYDIPAYKYHGVLVYFAAFKNHIGFYPTGSGIAAFADDFKKYKTSKGTVQFPLDKALPLALIKKIIRYRLKVNLEKEKASVKTSGLKVKRH